MRWLVTGAAGQLGHRLSKQLPVADALCVTRSQLDISAPDEVERAIVQYRPEVVINAAAYTAVDAAESDEATAMAINRDGPGNIARALRRHGGRLIHVSTDYVFDGEADRPYEPDDEPNPQTVYGRTKLAGERAAIDEMPERTVIVRTAWVYGGPGKNFVDTMRRLERERATVEVVADQTGSPTFAEDLAAGLISLGGSATSSGVLHFVNEGRATWADLARETFRLAGADPSRVRDITSAEYSTPAPRPRWSVLSTRSWDGAGLPKPRTWDLALAAYFSEKGD